MRRHKIKSIFNFLKSQWPILEKNDFKNLTGLEPNRAFCIQEKIYDRAAEIYEDEEEFTCAEIMNWSIYQAAHELATSSDASTVVVGNLSEEDVIPFIERHLEVEDYRHFVEKILEGWK